MGIFPKSAERIIGVDIGTHAIKVVSVKAGCLTGIGIADISSDSLRGLSVEAKDELVTNVLKRILLENKIALKNTVSSVSGNGVIVRYITLPKMTEKELAATIKFEAEPHISFDIDQVILDYYISGEKVEKDLKKMDVILIAAKKEIVHKHLGILEAAGLTPIAIDVDAFALEGEYEFNHPDEKMNSVALINIGSTFTNVNIIENGISRFTRDVLIAGNNFTKVIQRDLRLDYREAEALKREKGAVLLKEEAEKLGENTADNSDEDEQEDLTLDICEAIRGPVNELLSEIQRSFDYYQAQTHEKSITKVIISGGSAKLKNIDKFFSQELKIPVEIDNPFIKLQINYQVYPQEYIETIAPFFSVALGLAIRGKK